MTRQMQLGNVCLLFGEEDCRFLSQERTTRAFTRIEKNQTTGMYEPVGMGSRKVVLGLYCNNHGFDQSGWVEKMSYCPKLWAMNRGVTFVKGVAENRKVGRRKK